MAERRIVFRPPYGYGVGDGDPLTDNDGVTHQTKVLLFQDLAGDSVEVLMLAGDVEAFIAKLRGVETAPASALRSLGALNGRA